MLQEMHVCLFQKLTELITAEVHRYDELLMTTYRCLFKIYGEGGCQL